MLKKHNKHIRIAYVCSAQNFDNPILIYIGIESGNKIFHKLRNVVKIFHKLRNHVIF